MSLESRYCHACETTFMAMPQCKDLICHTCQQIEKHSVPNMLQEAAETYKQRNELYGDNYKRFGKIMMELIPQGVEFQESYGDDRWNRLGLLIQIVSKLTRYCNNFAKGGHDDSLQDLAVYATMLRELDKEYNDIPF